MALALRKAWALLDIIVSVLLCYSGVRWMQAATTGADDVYGKVVSAFTTGVLGFYIFTGGVLVFLTAVFYAGFFEKWCSAAYTFFGRGITFIFFGSLCIRNRDTAAITIGAIVIVVGVLYLILQFISRVGRPLQLFGAKPMPEYPPQAQSEVLPTRM